MFCPNCGTQNDSAATPCKKCGFKLSGISVPKFKGTMMLNSDQTVQELIEEHRRKQAPGGAAEKIKGRASEPAPRKSPGSSSPPSSLGGPKGPVLQPPRAAAPARGRMGGTMLGVAPQVGGYAPPPAGLAAPPAPTSPSPAPGSEPPRSETAVDTPPPAGANTAAFAGTVELPRAEPSSDGALAQAPVAEGASERAAVHPTRPLPFVSSVDAAEAAGVDAAASAAAPELPGDEPAPVRPITATAPLPRVSEPEKPTPAGEAAPASPPRLRALDIVLIVCTCGIYGLVLWARQRKASA